MFIIKVYLFGGPADFIPPFCNPFHFPEQGMSLVLQSAFHVVQI
jgi:hypothetical protein